MESAPDESRQESIIGEGVDAVQDTGPTGIVFAETRQAAEEARDVLRSIEALVPNVTAAARVIPRRVTPSRRGANEASARASRGKAPSKYSR